MIVESYEDVIVLSGALRSNFWETIHTAISLTLKRHPSGVIIDCSGITEVTADGAETFHDAIDFVNEHDRARIIVAAVPPEVLEVLRSVPEVRSQLPIAASVAEARKSLDLLSVSEEPPRKRKEPVKPYSRQILACMNGDRAGDLHVLSITKELSAAKPAKVVILLPIVVPRDLPLQAPMPEIEDRAVEMADVSHKELTELSMVHETRLERTRDLPTLLQEVAQEIDAEHVVVAIRPDQAGDDASQRMIRSVIEKVDRSLIFARAPRKT